MLLLAAVNNWLAQAIAGVGWPASLQHISFAGGFDKPIAGVVGWPARLKKVSFRNSFNQPIAGGGVVWSPSIL